MGKRFQIVAFLALFSFSVTVYAQEGDKPVVEVSSAEELGTVTDSFQEYFFEALKQKAIENHEKAINALTQALALNPSESVVYLELGKNYNALGKYSQAAVYLMKGRAALPENEEILAELYNTYFLSEEFDKALPVVQDLQKLNSSYSEDLVNLYILNEKFDLALSLLDTLDEKWGSSMYREGLRRQVYSRTNNVEAQVENLQEKIEENPKDEKDYLNLIFVYSENGEADKAFETAQKLLAVNPSSELVHLALYKFYMEEDAAEKAVNSMRILLGSEQIDEVTKYQALNDFLIYVTENPSLEEELIELVQVFSENENNSKVYKQLGTFFFEKGDRDQALYYFDLALENETGDFGLYNQVLQLNMELGDFEKVNVLSGRALEVFPSQPLLYLTKGTALNKLSKFEEAETVLIMGQDFIIDDPRLSSDFYLQLSKAYLGMNQPEKASEFQKKAEELKNNKS